MGCYISALFGKCFQSYSKRQQQKQNNQTVPKWNKFTGTCLINHKSQVQQTTELGLVSFCSLHHELGHSARYVFGLNIPCHQTRRLFKLRNGDNKVTIYRNIN